MDVAKRCEACGRDVSEHDCLVLALRRGASIPRTPKEIPAGATTWFHERCWASGQPAWMQLAKGIGILNR